MTGVYYDLVQVSLVKNKGKISYGNLYMIIIES